MTAFIYGLLAVIGLFIFFNLGKVKASKKQTNRNDRINYANPPWRRKNAKSKSNNQDQGSSNIIEGKAEEIKNEDKD